MPSNYLGFRPTTSFGTNPLSVSVPFTVSHLSLLDCPSTLAVHMSFSSHALVIDPYVLSPTEPENMNRVLEHLCILNSTIQKELIKCWLNGSTHKKYMKIYLISISPPFSFIATFLFLNRSLLRKGKHSIYVFYVLTTYVILHLKTGVYC